MLIHFSIILIVFKFKKVKFSQISYDSLFYCIENNLRESGLGDVAVNKKMKEINKILYDILLKIRTNTEEFKINQNLIFKYFSEFNKSNDKKYELFNVYLSKFYHFCFELPAETMIKDAINFKE